MASRGSKSGGSKPAKSTLKPLKKGPAAPVARVMEKVKRAVSGGAKKGPSAAAPKKTPVPARHLPAKKKALTGTPFPVAPVPTRRAPADAQTIVSIPDDVVLSPSSELPRHMLGQDRSVSRRDVRELSWRAFDRHVQELARAIRKRYDVEAVIGVAHGGVFVGGALASALQREFYPVRISRRSRDAASQKSAKTPRPELSGEMPKELRGRNVLIADDVAASGETLEFASTLATRAGASNIATVALVMKPEGFAPDFFAMVTDELVVFPWDYSPAGEGGPLEPPRG